MVPKQSEQGEKYPIPLENEPFFYNLAQDLHVLEGEERANKRCQVCGLTTGDLTKCPKCGTASHGECMAMWAKMSNIGLPHVFRCMSCYNLLRLPKDFVVSVQSGSYKKPTISVKAADQTSLLRQKESVSGARLKKTSDPLAGMADMGNIDLPNESEAMETQNNSTSTENEEPDFEFKDEPNLIIQFCPQCANLNSPEVLRCAKCGYRLK